jgi:ATP-binding cassette subfamily B protein
MKSSPEGAQPKANAIEPLPPTLSSMWRVCRLGYQHERRLMIFALLLSQVAALPGALLAVWLALLGEGVVHSTTMALCSAPPWVWLSVPRPPGS